MRVYVVLTHHGVGRNLLLGVYANRMAADHAGARACAGHADKDYSVLDCSVQEGAV